MTRAKSYRNLTLVLGLLLAGLIGSPAHARDYSAGEGGAAEIDACAKDAAKYCNDDIMWQHEMEDCLREHIGQISKACRAQIKPFDFKQYYNSEPHLF